jgi:hypothetical protein
MPAACRSGGHPGLLRQLVGGEEAAGRPGRYSPSLAAWQCVHRTAGCPRSAAVLRATGSSAAGASRVEWVHSRMGSAGERSCVGCRKIDTAIAGRLSEKGLNISANSGEER